MKKAKIFLLSGIGLLFAGIAKAQITIQNPISASSFSELILNIADGFTTIALAIAPVMIVVGAFYFLTAGGSPERIKTAKEVIMYALIGVIIAVSAKGIIQMIQGWVGAG